MVWPVQTRSLITWTHQRPDTQDLQRGRHHLGDGSLEQGHAVHPERRGQRVGGGKWRQSQIVLGWGCFRTASIKWWDNQGQLSSSAGSFNYITFEKRELWNVFNQWKS